jgi:uncharacterized protein
LHTISALTEKALDEAEETLRKEKLLIDLE